METAMKVRRRILVNNESIRQLQKRQDSPETPYVNIVVMMHHQNINASRLTLALS